MKKIIIFLTLIFIITACQQDNFLERESTTSVSEERVFENAELIKLFVNNMYADIPNFFMTILLMNQQIFGRKIITM